MIFHKVFLFEIRFLSELQEEKNRRSISDNKTNKQTK
jgi:hypothetical protein